MGVISLQIVKYNWKNQWFSSSKITLLMSCAAVLSSKMTMISHFDKFICFFYQWKILLHKYNILLQIEILFPLLWLNYKV